VGDAMIKKLVNVPDKLKSDIICTKPKRGRKRTVTKALLVPLTVIGFYLFWKIKQLVG